MARNEYEHLAQVALFEWIDWMAKRDPRFECIFAVPNGGDRHGYVAAKLKTEGVRAGVPDIFVAVPTYFIGESVRDEGVRQMLYPGLFIEMKIKPNTVKKHQQAWLDRLSAQGYLTKVCWSEDEAIEAIAQYLGVESGQRSSRGSGDNRGSYSAGRA